MVDPESTIEAITEKFRGAVAQQDPDVGRDNIKEIVGLANTANTDTAEDRIVVADEARDAIYEIMDQPRIKVYGEPTMVRLLTERWAYHYVAEGDGPQLSTTTEQLTMAVDDYFSRER